MTTTTTTTTMQVHLNHEAHELPDGTTLAEALQRLPLVPPYAAAVNLQFVPRTAHADHVLHDGDRVEVIAPVTGG